MRSAKTHSAARVLFRALSKLKLGESYLRQTVLPEWWDDAIAESPAGRDDLHLMLARMLGLDALSLREGKPRFVPQPVAKLKAHRNRDDDSIGLARHIAVQVAKLVALGMTKPVILPTSAAEVRTAILKAGRPWIDLQGLLDFCWESGIAVVHVGKWPAQCKKMAALVASIDGRPVVVVADNHKASAWSLFIIAHELGHLACGHVPDGSVLVDKEVDKNSRDREEAEANRFAIELLTGDGKTRVRATDRLPRAAELVASAKRWSTERSIDPGHFVLNYAASMGETFWPVANAALKQLEPLADAPAAIRHMLHDRIDWSKMPATSAEFVLRTLGREHPAA